MELEKSRSAIDQLFFTENNSFYIVRKLIKKRSHGDPVIITVRVWSIYYKQPEVVGRSQLDGLLCKLVVGGV